MPLRFNRRFAAGPFRVNLSRSGISASIGRRGAWLTLGSDHGRATVGVPETGLSWYEHWRITAARNPVLRIFGIVFVVIVVIAVLFLR
jgi:hypothetical protein